MKIRSYRLVYTFLTCYSLLDGAVYNAHLRDGWYPQKEDVLRTTLDTLFAHAAQTLKVPIDPDDIYALIAPHAGVEYAGLCAAAGFSLLRNRKKPLTKVIVLAPSHNKSFYGVALPSFDRYKTVLGTTILDKYALKILEKKSQLCHIDNDVYAHEHSLEMQLIYLQHSIVSSKWQLIPCIIGQISLADAALFASLLKTIIDEDTLVVVSTDFTHYGENFDYTPFKDNVYNRVRFQDFGIIDTIVQKNAQACADLINRTHATVCGREPLKIFLALIHDAPVTISAACYYMSTQKEDLPSRKIPQNNMWMFCPVTDKRMVKGSVSYTSLIASKKKKERNSTDFRSFLTTFEEQDLLCSARKSIAGSFYKKQDNNKNYSLAIPSNNTKQQYGSFVTLYKKNKELRGCVGTVTTSNELRHTVYDMARAAAFHDDRFSPLTEEELCTVMIDISVLDKPHAIKSYKDIILGKHGIILKKISAAGAISASAVFLPHVATDFGWDLTKTLEQLSVKAGLPADGWKSCSFDVFEGFSFAEK